MNTHTCSKRHLVVLVLAFSPLAGCGTASKNLIFFTNTSFGVDVGSDPTSGAPIKAVIGFKRQEGVLNPVYDETERTETKDEQGKPTSITTKGGLRDQAYSVIAKYQGSAQASANTDMSSAQWFATGLAAEKLADAPGIAGAVTGSAKVAEAAAKERAGIFGGERLGFAAQNATLKAVMQALDDLAAKDVEAKVLAVKVGAFATRYTKSRVRTVDQSADPKRLLDVGTTVPHDAAKPWSLILAYRNVLEASEHDLAAIVKDPAKTIADPSGNPVADELAAYDEIRDELRKLDAELAASGELAEAVRHICKHLGG